MLVTPKVPWVHVTEKRLTKGKGGDVEGTSGPPN